MEVDLSPRKVLAALLSAAGILFVASLVVTVARFGFGHGLYGLGRLFDLNGESNVPTLYSSLQLVVASSLLWLVAVKHKSNGTSYFPWVGLSIIFLFLAVDETAQIHERLIGPFRKRFGFTGFLYFAWIVPYGIAVLGFVIAYARFLFALPTDTMRLFIVSGVLYVTGAIGIEALSANHVVHNGGNNALFAIYSTCEEVLELVGIALFIFAILEYMAREFQYLRTTIRA